MSKKVVFRIIQISSILVIFTLLTYTLSAANIDASWGLGNNETKYIKNNRSYSWYIDQGNTGKYSSSNCGPSSVTMAIKWTNGDFKKTAEDARNFRTNNGDWWYTNDIKDYLNEYNTNYTEKNISNTTGENLFISELNKGNIIILCLNMSLISYNSNSEERVNSFYKNVTGHFIILKGYRIVDENIFFEVYDPYSMGKKYQNGQPKGLDRYYLSDELVKSTVEWWNKVIVINNPQTNNSEDEYNSSTNETTSKIDNNTSTPFPFYENYDFLKSWIK